MSIKKILTVLLPFIVLSCSPALAQEWEKYDKPVPTRSLCASFRMALK